MNDNSSTPSFGLARLLGSTSPQKFLSEYWPRRFFFRRGTPEVFEALQRIEPLAHVDDLLTASRSHANLMQTWFPADDIRYTHWGRHGSARAAYDEGARLQFNQAERWLPELYPLLGALERDLALPLDSASCTILATPPGARAVPHIDSYPQFTVQWIGDKRWSVGPEVCPYSLASIVMDENPEAARSFFDGDLPRGMTPDAAEHRVRPGDVLFVPSGVLHAVESLDHSISIAFDLVIPRWTEVITNELVAQLSRSERWRSFALGLGSTASAEQRGAAVAAAGALLAELPAAVARLQAEPERCLDAVRTSILRREWTHLAPAPAASLHLLAPALDRPQWTVEIDHPRHGRSEIEINDELVAASRWIVARRDPFTDVQALYAARGAHAANVGQLLQALVECHGLRPVAEAST